jgi:ankyrin repeat protein
VGNTCDWVLNRPEFIKWKSIEGIQHESKLLWIHGPGGYGKTIICARIIEILKSTLASPVAHFFFSSDVANIRDPYIIIRSWISQIITEDHQAYDLVSDSFSNCNGPPTRQEILQLFETIAQTVPNLFLIVDGIDEFAERGNRWDKPGDGTTIGFLRFIGEVSKTTNLRILIASRSEPSIRDSLRNPEDDQSGREVTEISIQPDDVRDDAARFSRSIINQRLASLTQMQRDELSHRMVGQSDGMFLWIKLLGEQLDSWETIRQLRRTIDQTPARVSDIYDRNWNRVASLGGRAKFRAVSILRWVVFALRPMTIGEIREALLAMDDDFEDILDDESIIDDHYVNSGFVNLCGSLIETRGDPAQDPASRTVHLVHFSARQYVLQHIPTPKGSALDISLSEAVNNNELASICLRYLCSSRVWEVPLIQENSIISRPFRTYALDYWYKHVKPQSEGYQDVLKAIKALFRPEAVSWVAWANAFNEREPESLLNYDNKLVSPNPLLYAAWLGFSDVLEYLIEEKGLLVDLTDNSKRTALLAASYTGNRKLAERLIAWGGDVNLSNNTGQTPLIAAALRGQKEIVELLLQNGADASISNERGFNPLYAACRNGHIEIFQLFLDRGWDSTVMCPNGYTALHGGAGGGHIDIVRKSIERGAVINLVSSSRWTALNIASMAGHVEVVKILLENGADLTIPEQDGCMSSPFVVSCISYVWIYFLLLFSSAHGGWSLDWYKIWNVFKSLILRLLQ